MEKRPRMLHFIGKSQHTKLYLFGDSARYKNGPLRKCFADAQRKRRLIGYHAELIGSARLAECGRGFLLFLSPLNILHLNRRPRTRARSLLFKVQWPPFLVQLKNILKG